MVKIQKILPYLYKGIHFPLLLNTANWYLTLNRLDLSQLKTVNCGSELKGAEVACGLEGIVRKSSRPLLKRYDGIVLSRSVLGLLFQVNNS